MACEFWSNAFAQQCLQRLVTCAPVLSRPHLVTPVLEIFWRRSRHTADARQNIKQFGETWLRAARRQQYWSSVGRLTDTEEHASVLDRPLRHLSALESTV